MELQEKEKDLLPAVQDSKSKTRPKNERKLLLVIAVLVIIIIILVIALIVYSTKSKCNNEEGKGQSKQIRYDTTFLSCKKDASIIDLKYRSDENIFQELNLEDIQAIKSYISKHFDIRPRGTIPLRNLSYIQNIELFIPDKEDALKFLNGNGPRPERRAIVTIVQAPTYRSYYIVGPVEYPTYHRLAQFSDRENPLPYLANPGEISDTPKFFEFSQMAVRKMWPLFKATYAEFKPFQSADGAFKSGLKPGPCQGTTQMDGEIVLLMGWRLPTINEHMKSLSTIAVMINCTSTNEDDWSIKKVIYHLTAYNDIESLMDLYRNNKLKIIKRPTMPKKQLRTKGTLLNYFPSGEPILVSPQGPRFSIQGKKIKYFDWEFNYLMHMSAGPALYDVRYNNQRIAFEISLQEASSFYTTGSPHFSSVRYLDSTWRLGSSKSLIHGIDCPYHAIYMDVLVIKNGGRTVPVKDAICVFESNPSMPLRRHHHATSQNTFLYTGMTDAILVVRMVLDFLNYDYIQDFIFHQNGAIEVKTTTTGHLIVSPFYQEHGNSYGYKVKDNFLGGIHDHFMLFKVDLDILGTKNSFKTVDLKLRKFQNDWDLKPVYNKYIVDNKRTTELNATINYNFDQPKYYILYNENHKNKYDNVRGYRILPTRMVKQIYPDDDPGTSATQWSKYQLSVSKFKETERYGSCMFNSFPMYEKARCSFDTFISDNDNIENEDLVLWIPIGGLHIPCAEDFPLTPTVGNQFSLFLKPFNYFDEDPSFRSPNSVFINKTKSKVEVETNGVPVNSDCGIPKRHFL